MVKYPRYIQLYLYRIYTDSYSLNIRLHIHCIYGQISTIYTDTYLLYTRLNILQYIYGYISTVYIATTPLHIHFIYGYIFPVHTATRPQYIQLHIYCINVLLLVFGGNITLARYGYHTRILRPRNIQFYAPNFTPPFYAPRNTIPNQVNVLS